MTHAHAPIRRLLAPVFIALLSVALLLPATAAAKKDDNSGKGKVATVMTRNIYLGADLGPAIAANSLPELVEANGIIFRQVLGNDFPTRAEGLADEILETKPDLVGLQEVALWETTPITPAGTELTLDYLDLLLDELNEGKGKNGKGKPQYRVVVVQEEFGTEAPANVNNVAGDGPPVAGLENAEVNGKLTMRDVILARHGAGIRTWNEQGGNFENLLELEIAGQNVPVLRGWTATDAKVRGSHAFRFVNTHLEAFHPGIRLEQAEELVDADGPANSSLPVILLGDLNSDDDTVSGADRLAYNFLIGAGFENRSTDEPLSCCLEVADLAVGAGGDISDFDHQVDHILTRNPGLIKLVSSGVTGLEPVNGFWNSDHAGVFSALRFVR